MSSLTYSQLLRRNQSFRRLWAGQVISELGNWFNFIAGLGLVRAVSSGAPEATAILIVARLAPFALFAPFAGALVDRCSRRTVMIASDAARAVFALGFLLVRTPDDLWIAYVCTVISTLLSAFFEAGKNAALPNVTGDRELLAGNALMTSSRFLLMAVGAALGGEASARFGYETAFVINALSFVVSAYSIWLIPEREMRAANDEGGVGGDEAPRAGHAPLFWTDMREGWAYISQQPLLAALIGVNILWATGGGAVNLVYDRLGGVVFAGGEDWNPDQGVAFVYTAVAVGLVVGLMLARRVGTYVEMRGATGALIGWTLVAHGILFALAGLMPTLPLAALMISLSRVLIGIEFAVHETMLMRLLPDNLRGRVFTTDRAAEVFVMSLTGVLAGWSLDGWLTPRSLTIVSGLLSASPGVVWLLLFAAGKLQMPRHTRPSGAEESDDETRAAFAS
ncbi:MAG TPA: MFS transporter [Pyrinomonadaceae bacterium]|nr:MFS transporter [Pyrinomonadaceae bacterium]